MSEIGRGDWIRTSDPRLPKTVLYQAELHPEVIRLLKNCCEARLRRRALLAPSPICLRCLGHCAACA